MSQQDDHLAYGHYNPQQDTARGGGGASARGLVGDTFKKLKDSYKNHQGQQPGQSQPYGYSHGPNTGSQSNYQQQYPYGQQTQNPPYHGTPPKDDKVSGILGKLQGRVVDIGSDVAQRLGTAIDPHAYAGYGQVKPDENQPFPCFAPSRQGNDVKWYVDGCSYFYAVSKALEAAHESIWILGAWVSPELYLRRPPTKNEQYRLDRVLQAAAQRGVRVNVIVQDEPSSSHSEQHLQGLHPNIAVLRYADNSPNAGSWAQNEKLCLIDGRMAFLGGFDLAFGNWDTNQQALSDFHPANPAETVYLGQDYKNSRVLTSQDASWNQNQLDRTSAPRMGWSDVGVCVHGQVVDDLRRHFVERWNFIYGARYESRHDSRYSRLMLYGRPLSSTGQGQQQSQSPKPPQSPQPPTYQQYQPSQPQHSTQPQAQSPQPSAYQNQYQPAHSPQPDQQHSLPQQQAQPQHAQSPQPSAYQHPEYQQSQYQPAHSPQPGQQQHSLPQQQAQSPQPSAYQHPEYQQPGQSQYQPAHSPQPGQQHSLPQQQSQSPQPSAYQHPEYQQPGQSQYQQHSPQPQGQQQQSTAYQHPEYQHPQGQQPGQPGNQQQQISPYQAYPGAPSQSSSPGYHTPNYSSPAQPQETPQYTYSGQSFPPPPPGPPPNLSSKPSQPQNQSQPYFAPPPTQETQTRGIEGEGTHEGDMDRGIPLPRRFKKDDLTQYGNALRGQLAGQIHQYQDRLTSFGRPPVRGNMSCQIVRSCGMWSHGSEKEHSIADAYVAIIRNSEHFIYIENESFITATSDQKPVQNQIGAAIVERILRAARAGKKYKVIVVIPCSPGFAGDLSDQSAAGTRAIMEAQYNSINRGGNSIMEMVAKEGYNPMEYIRFYNLRTYDRINMGSTAAELDSTSAPGYGPSSRSAFDPTAPYPAHNAASTTSTVSGRWDSVSECHMLNGEDIRKVPWEGPSEAEISAFVTEELHVHSKVMIADDRIVICGSASITDKSLLGDHDSEVAMLIEDYTPILSVMDSKTYTASRFAASLRRELFRKHLGLLPAQDPQTATANCEVVGVPNTFDTEAPESRLVADPLADTFTSLWNSRAKTNTEVFRKVFHVVPDDSVRDWGTYKEFYGYCFHDAETQRGVVPARYRYGHVVGDDFPPGTEGVMQVKELLGQVRGSLVEMPLMFLIQEDLAR